MKNIINQSYPPVTDEMITYAEQYFQVKLPKSYIELLRISNGGILKRQYLDIREIEGPIKEEEFIYFDRLLGIVPPELKQTLSGTSIVDTQYLKEEWGIQQENIILIGGDGHYWIALDYRLSEEPRITYIDTENASECLLFNHFDEMIEHLYDTVDGNLIEIDTTNFTKENLFENLYANDYRSIEKGLLIWSNMVFLANKEEDLYYNRILEIFKLEGLDFLTQDEQITLRFSIALTVCDVLKHETNIINQKFLEQMLLYLKSVNGMDGLKYLIETEFTTYKERWG